MSQLETAAQEHQAGLTALQAGQGELALKHLQRASELASDVPRYWCNLAEAQRRQAQHESAHLSFKKALALDPVYAKAWRGLGATCFAIARIDEAEAAFEHWLASAEDVASAHAFLADCARVRGLAGKAIALYRKALELDKDHRHSLLNLPLLLLRAGAETDALEMVAQARQRHPDDIGLLIHQGECLKSLERFEEAMDCFADAWEQRSDSVSLCCSIAEVWEELGELIQADLWLARAREMDPADLGVRLRQVSLLRSAEQAEDALNLIAGLRLEHPDNTDVLMHQARTEFECGDAEAALRSYSELIAQQPERSEFDVARAHVCVALGDLAVAADGFRSALIKNPHSLAAVAGLATTLRHKMTNAELQQLHAALARPQVPESIQAQLLMGLAMLHDGRGDYPQAAEAATMANNLQSGHAQRRHRHYDPNEFAAHVSQIETIFTAARLAELRTFGDPDARPAFIIGMPRSGTTLTEQILNAHPHILGVGERPYAQRGVMRATQTRDLPSALVALDKVDGKLWNDTALWHLQQLLTLERAAERTTPTQRIVDKMPDNYQWAGYLHALFPNAKLIYLYRDPRDIALSNWMNLFSQIRWANDLEHIAERLIGHYRLMQHWRKVLPPGVLVELDYQTLTAQPEAESRRLIAALGLDWDPQCLNFHQNRTLVRTASVTQVREPVHTRAVARWKHYERELQPLIARLAAAELLPV